MLFSWDRGWANTPLAVACGDFLAKIRLINEFASHRDAAFSRSEPSGRRTETYLIAVRNIWIL